MPFSFNDITVPGFIQLLETTSKLLNKDITHTSATPSTISEKDALEGQIVSGMGDLFAIVLPLFSHSSPLSFFVLFFFPL
jgi:hypothetical protein